MGPQPHLVVPVQVAALVTHEAQKVVQSHWDLSRLPFFDGHRDVNTGTAYVSQSITPAPFEDLDVELLPGVHLHWTLPAALRVGEHDADGVRYPAVPTRWLVRRTVEGQPTGEWVVESDYLHPQGDVARPDHVSFPVPTDPAAGRHQPFRHLGRTVPAGDWKPIDPPAEHLGRLTAVGYGNPTFASYYPSCRDVFGFHDEQLPNAESRYDIVGWYPDPDQDLMAHARERAHAELGRPPTTAELAGVLADRLHLSTGDDNVLPRRSLLVGSVVVTPGTATAPTVPPFPSITLAPSAEDAVARNLATKVHGFASTGGPTGNHWTRVTPLQVEERLDHVLLGAAVDPQHIDAGPRFETLCHRRSFGAVPAGLRWQLVPATDAAQRADVTESTNRSLPDAAADALDRLDGLQRARDRVYVLQRTAATQIFADWQKWMSSQYSPDQGAGVLPDPDRILDLIRRHDLTLSADLRERLSQLEAQIGSAAEELEVLLEGTGLQAVTTAAPPAYVPQEPYVLLDGPAVTPTSNVDRPAAGVTTDCPTVTTTTADLGRLLADVASVTEALPPPARSSTDDPPWQPVLLDWEVEFFAVEDPVPEAADKNGAPDDSERYPADHLLRHYEYGSDDDLRLLPDAPTAPSADIVAGRSLLTCGATTRALDALERTIWARMVRDGYWDPEPPPPETQRSAYLGGHVAEIYRRYLDDDRAEGVFTTSLFAYTYARNRTLMGQVLSGFNAAMLSHRQIPQLPIDDPLGFREHEAFTEDVREAVGGEALWSPLPEARFNPLRAGDLSLLRLRLIDTFGRHVDFDRDDTAGEEAAGDEAVEFTPSRQLERNPRHPARVHLPARLVQAARIRAAWLSATGEAEESGDHPLRSPLCGWFVADHLDSSLLVYQRDGRLAGSLITGPDTIDPTKARWLPAPGDDGLAHPAELENDHLRAAVARLRDLGAEGLAAHLDRIDHTLETIEPQAAADRADLAVLMGQPFALVRARIDLHVLGRLAVDQGWEALRSRLGDDGHGPSADRGLGEVVVRVRLGDLRMLDDGLLGYWVERPDGTTSPLHLADTEVVAHGDGTRTVTGQHGTDLRMTLDGDPVAVAMLVDPRAAVHVTSGLLPGERLAIPADHVEAAARRLAFGFLAAPLLSPEGPVHLPVTHHPGYRWSWAAREGVAWHEVGEEDLITAVPPGIDRPQVLHDGWMVLQPVSVDDGGPA